VSVFVIAVMKTTARNNRSSLEGNIIGNVSRFRLINRTISSRNSKI